MRSMLRLPHSGPALSAFVKGVVLLAGTQLALAETGPHPAAGVLQLPNVRVESASASQVAAANAPTANPSQSAARAYKDPVTGELREQTPEEMMEGGVTSSKAAASRAAPKAAIASPSGGKVYSLDETFMMNSVVTKAADGTTYMQCVTGHDAAVDAVLQGKAGKAHRHDR